jgi:predicted phosphoadenosine phosphosulfate sulfurtransferase
MKKYLNKNVYEMAKERIAYLFQEFDNVLVSFSGGKDSGVCLNLCYDYAKENNLLHKLAMYHLDYEAQYEHTTQYVTETFEQFDGIKKYWLCLPIEAQCACRMDGAFWTPWAKENKDIWVRDMPCNEWIINEDNAPFKVERGLTDNDMQDVFCDWFKNTYGKTAVIVGIRCQESYERLMIIVQTDRRLRYKGNKWTITNQIGKIDHGMKTFAYPIYDWQVEDVWVYFAKTGHKYNKLYDLYYKAGLSVNQMRVASPFNNCAMGTLKLYKVIDPNNWGKMTGRVNGVNFAGLYGGTTAMGWKSIKLPKGHTWKSYCYFLLSTLDEKLRKHYERILATSIEYWCEKGGFVSEEIMPELEALKADYEDKGKSERYENQRILKFALYPDELDTKSFAKLPSYKRMCVCILKNDYYCTYMGFGKTKEAIEKRKRTLEKYKNL